MRYTQAEKMEIIRLVEGSSLSVRGTLHELDVNRSSFYTWYRRYEESGYDGLANKKPTASRFWNCIPKEVKDQVVQLAVDLPEESPRQLAWKFTDREGYYLSESSVYRILKSYDLVTSPAYTIITAADKFQHPTTRVHELWQTDFTYFKVIGWGWYYLGSVLDDFSRFIIAWKLFTSMAAEDVRDLLERAVETTGIQGVPVKHRPRLLSDNGPCYISSELQEYLEARGIAHTRGAPYHPMTQGKIERYHRSMKNEVTLTKYYFPWELQQEIGRFVEHYNNHRYHESLNNVTPADVYYGRNKQIENRREKIKKHTMKLRREQNLLHTNHHLSHLNMPKTLS